ncbi:dihydroneopterin aldolase [Neolewinella lacunae]|uniref:7,8-dihydroneopterin aldolase n=1 Tax=Neolewinella lacunae TaxID=1517758 RepID=A0A923PQ03_9BACT|nr:dihydroneopterin aldolase [Neolewinella lacunae]MBC6995671.1 dihydroneopterin aldolase [Neolewinella lacunae]MDN3634261.1 dihydroneopterin aldolase [Neolewinella lacunae]
MTAKIGLEDVRFYAPHGFFKEEHLMGNEFRIDVEVEASITGAAQEDDLGGTVNYATIYYLLQAEMKKPTQLLEALAYRMANRIMNQFESVLSVHLRLRKINPPLGGSVGAAVVEVNLGGSRTGGLGGGQPGRQDTFEDPAPRGGYDGFSGGYPKSDSLDGGFAAGGLSGITPKKTPPPIPAPLPADAFDDEDDDEDFDDDFDDDELAALGGDDDDDGFEGFDDDDDFDDDDFDNMDWDSMDFGDMNFPDFDPDDFK